MRILAVDVGTGTQDVLLFDTTQEPENALKMVMPSPTRLLAGRIGEATRAGEDLLLTGVTMGGGPCAWAAEQHIKAGHRAFATPDAARTFNDDLDEVVAMGVEVVGEEEAARLAGVRRLEMRDLDYEALAAAFRAFDVDLDEVEVLALAVFDHGAAPPGISDRLFRFGYLADRIGEGRGLAGFAFPADEVPTSMTRLQALASTAPAGRTATSATAVRRWSSTWATCTPWPSTCATARSPGCWSTTPACWIGQSWRACWPSWPGAPSPTTPSLPGTATAP